ncbi:MAG TPA: hypothetical protein VGN05_15690 [Parvibaculum sp.]
MKRTGFFIGAALAISMLGQAAHAAEQFDAAALPTDKVSLSRLNDEQLGLLRKSVRFCGDFGHTKHMMNFCVTSGLDLDVRQNGSAALKAFHWTLNPMDRYDDARSMVAVSRLVKE